MGKTNVKADKSAPKKPVATPRARKAPIKKAPLPTEKTVKPVAAAVGPWYSKIAANQFELVPMDQIKVIVARDVVYYTNLYGQFDATIFIQTNLCPYYWTINSWMNLIFDLTGEKPFDVMLMLKHDGFMSIIKSAAEAADDYIMKGEIPKGVWLRYAQLASDDPAGVLQLLRFPKRFCPEATDFMEKEVVTGFKQRNKAAKLFNRSNDLRELYELREIVHAILRPFSGKRADEACYALPTGATAEGVGCKTLAQKLLAVERSEPMFLPNLPTWPGNCSNPIMDKYCVGATVPKSYKTRRFIAEEQVARQTRMKALDDEVRRAMQSSKGRYGGSGRLNLNDDSRNNSLAYRGSVDGSLATIDLSAASDSVSCSLIRGTFPSEILKRADHLRSDTIRFPGGGESTLHLYSTMGSRLTFAFETVIFFAIALMGCEKYIALTGQRLDLSCVSAYGDDIVVPSVAAEVVVHYLELFGFTVNREKSFWGNSPIIFRESCGGEYINGHTVSSIYLPRKPIRQNVEGMLSLVSLQQRIHEHRRASLFLQELVLSVYKEWPVSAPFEGDYTLWSTTRVAESRIPANIAGRIESGKLIPVQCTCDAAIRRRIVTPVEKYSTQKVSPAEWDAAQRLAYNRFLREGPMYTDPLSELLHVSEHLSLDSIVGVAEQKLRFSWD